MNPKSLGFLYKIDDDDDDDECTIIPIPGYKGFQKSMKIVQSLQIIKYYQEKFKNIYLKIGYTNAGFENKKNIIFKNV